MIAGWFVVKRGCAMAGSSMGIGFAEIVMPFVVAPLLVWLGWHHTLGLFGALTVAWLVAPALIYIRRSPEDIGLHPDGLASVAVAEGEARHASGAGGPGRAPGPSG